MRLPAIRMGLSVLVKCIPVMCVLTMGAALEPRHKKGRKRKFTS